MSEIKQCAVCKAKPSEWAMPSRAQEGICWTCGAAAARWIQRHADQLHPLWSATRLVPSPAEDIPVPDHHDQVEAMLRSWYGPVTEAKRALTSVLMAEDELKINCPYEALISVAEAVEKMQPGAHELMPRAVAVLFSKQAGWCGDVALLRHALYPN